MNDILHIRLRVVAINTQHALWYEQFASPQGTHDVIY